VTRKITHRVARIVHGLDRELRLGNLDARRDWGYAPDYVRAMHAMLQLDHPRDYVIATGETHSVGEFCAHAFGHVGLDWRERVIVDPAFLRPAEVELLVGDASAARRDFSWRPSIEFPELVRLMVDADLALVAEELSRGSRLGEPSPIPSLP
jgi:GDPmannose 4,6-dehydratase